MSTRKTGEEIKILKKKLIIPTLIWILLVIMFTVSMFSVSEDKTQKEIKALDNSVLSLTDFFEGRDLGENLNFYINSNQPKKVEKLIREEIYINLEDNINVPEVKIGEKYYFEVINSQMPKDSLQFSFKINKKDKFEDFFYRESFGSIIELKNPKLIKNEKGNFELEYEVGEIKTIETYRNYTRKIVFNWISAVLIVLIGAFILSGFEILIEKNETYKQTKEIVTY